MDLHEQEYFISIVENMSMNKAAEKLHVSQSALSMYLKKLERKLGVALFTRSRSNALELTEAGRVYLGCCRSIVKDWNEAERKLQLMRKTEPYRIGISGPSESISLFNVCSEVRLHYPELNIQAENIYSVDAPGLIRENRIFAAISAYDSEAPDLAFREMSRFTCGLLVPKEHPLAVYSSDIPGQEDLKVPLKVIADYPVATIDRQMLFGRKVWQLFEQESMSPNMALTFTYLSNVRDFVKRTRCVGVVTLLSAEKRRQKGIPNDLLQIQLENSFVYRSGIIYRADAYVPESLDVLFETYIKRHQHSFPETQQEALD